MKPYERTHPWITFTLNLKDLDYRTWLLLGEAESKCQHLAGAPLRPDVARKLHEIYLSKGVHGTTSIEGNTLSEGEVLARIEGDLDLPPSREYLGREVDNIVAAYNEIVDDVMHRRHCELTVERIEEFNRRIQDGLPLKEDVVPGEVRTHRVGVGRYRGAPAEDLRYLLQRLCEWLNEGFGATDVPRELKFTIGVLKAVIAHLYIAWIHPFGDGNGRTARLMEFQLMIQAGIPLPAAHLLSDHYNLTRSAYYAELDKTSHGEYPIEGFIHYALRGFVDSLRSQLEDVQAQQLQVTWENYIHSSLSDNTPAVRRQKHLMLDMPLQGWISVPKVREVSGRVANDYASKTAKTVTRDLNRLAKLGLILRERGRVRANRGAVLQLLPAVAPNGD